jgi:type II secretory pathway pseudopilin PulG
VLPTGVPAENSGLALASMILGISGFLCGVTAIPAIICGHIALGKIKQSQGRIAGNGFAITGLITGYISLVIMMIAMVAGLTAPMVVRQKKKADQTEAISNARQISMALMEFESEYGSMPNAATAQLVAEATGEPAISGSSSNARFRQLFQAGITQSEVIFYAKAAGTTKPDGVIFGNNALAPSECGFGYIENTRTDDATPRPIAMAPFKRGSQAFDPMPFDGKAIVLWSDGSVRAYPIDRTSGEVILDGQNLLDPSHPIWGGVPPSLLLPE